MDKKSEWWRSLQTQVIIKGDNKYRLCNQTQLIYKRLVVVLNTSKVVCCSRALLRICNALLDVKHQLQLTTRKWGRLIIPNTASCHANARRNLVMNVVWWRIRLMCQVEPNWLACLLKKKHRDFLFITCKSSPVWLSIAKAISHTLDTREHTFVQSNTHTDMRGRH